MTNLGSLIMVGWQAVSYFIGNGFSTCSHGHKDKVAYIRISLYPVIVGPTLKLLLLTNCAYSQMWIMFGYKWV